MLNTMITTPGVQLGLKDIRLFREACYVDGQWIHGSSKANIEVDNPSSGQIVGKVPRLGGAETRQAIESAHRALKPWSGKTAKERAAILRRWFDLVLENQEDLARLMTIEQGKPLAESLGEIRYGASFVKWFAEEARRINGSTIPSPASSKSCSRATPPKR